MTGYHSMRKPEETINNSCTDVVILSNHVDFVFNKPVREIKSIEFNTDELTTDSICYKNQMYIIDNKSFKNRKY